MPLVKAAVQTMRPVTFVCTMRTTSLVTVASAPALPSARPALLTRISTSANASGSAAGIASTASVSIMSTLRQCTARPAYAASSSALSATSRSSRRATSTSLHPSSAKRHAVDRPKPLDAPVISTVHPVISSGAYRDDAIAVERVTHV